MASGPPHQSRFARGTSSLSNSQAAGAATGTATAERPAGAPSQTQTLTDARTETENPVAILRLRGAHNPSRRSVQWDESVVDNEGLGRKSSKVCCIYHRPRAVGESSDESSSSDSSSDSDDSESGDRSQDADRPGKGEGGSGKKSSSHSHSHSHGDCDRRHKPRRRGRRDRPGGDDPEKRNPSPNAYEKMPRNRPRDGTGGPAGGGGS